MATSKISTDISGNKEEDSTGDELQIFDLLISLSSKVDDMADRLSLVEDKIENMSYKIHLLSDELPTSLQRIQTKVRRRKQTIPYTRTNASTSLSHENDDYVHRDVLRDSHKTLMDSMTLQDSTLDILVQKNAIDQSDNEEVMAHPSRKERVRCLLLKLAHHDETTFMQFIEALKQEKRLDLATLLRQKYDEYKETRTNVSSKCNHCQIKLRVDIKDVIDTLYQERVIDEAFLDKVNRSPPSARNILWNECFFKLKRSNKHNILSHCLDEKNKKYVTEPAVDYFKCTCFKMALSFDRNSIGTWSTSGSLADRSDSTSTSSPFSTFSSISGTIDRNSDFDASSSSRRSRNDKGGRRNRTHVRSVFDRSVTENIPEENSNGISEYTESDQPAFIQQTAHMQCGESQHSESVLYCTKL